MSRSTFFGAAQHLPDSVGNGPLQHIHGDIYAVTIVSAFFAAALVIIIDFLRGADGHCRLALGAKHLAFERVVPFCGRSSTLLPFVGGHFVLHFCKQLLVDDRRDRILDADAIGSCCMGISGAVLPVWALAVNQSPDVFFVFEQIV